MKVIHTGEVQDSQMCLQTPYKSVLIADKMFFPTGFKGFLFVFLFYFLLMWYIRLLWKPFKIQIFELASFYIFTLM